MCGICGVITKKELSLENLREMNDSMYHRGPDDSGEELFNLSGFSAGLAHRRLSIMDLSSRGHQPMHSASEDIVLVFNGEIYNFKSLKESLRDKYTFYSNSDTEVIIAAYKEWGIDCVNKFNGMFAIALLDFKINKLFLIRDRFGKKPLYYFKTQDDFVFASELKPILKYNYFTKKLNKKVLPEFFVKQYIKSPNTIFEDVYKVNPGEIIVFENFIITKKQYWNFYEEFKKRKNSFLGSFEEAKKKFKEELLKAIDYRFISDVPVGMLLSGGYDSSLITALACKDKKRVIKSFTIGFNDEKLDEAKFAKAVADKLGLEHTEKYITEDDMLNLVRKIPKYYDEPFADSSQIATMLVSSLAKESVTVVLAGDGADELLAGYNTHLKLEIVHKLDFLSRIVYLLFELPVFGKLFEKIFPFSMKILAYNRNKLYKTQFEKYQNIKLTKSILGTVEDALYSEKYIKEKDWSLKRMILDTETYLPDDILCKIDRASMSCSLEARDPYLDINFVNFVISLPQKFKLNRNQGKRILKELCWENLPKNIMDRPKRGFSVPIGKWLQKELKNDLLRYSSEDFLQNQNIFDIKGVQKIISTFLNNTLETKKGKKIDSFIWSFFIFQQWYESYME